MVSPHSGNRPIPHYILCRLVKKTLFLDCLASFYQGHSVAAGLRRDALGARAERPSTATKSSEAVKQAMGPTRSTGRARSTQGEWDADYTAVYEGGTVGICGH